MWDASEFMKTQKQYATVSFNGRRMTPARCGSRASAYGSMRWTSSGRRLAPTLVREGRAREGRGRSLERLHRSALSPSFRDVLDPQHREGHRLPGVNKVPGVTSRRGAVKASGRAACGARDGLARSASLREGETLTAWSCHGVRSRRVLGLRERVTAEYPA